MKALAIVSVALGLGFAASSAAAVSPPPAPGPWAQVGKAMTSGAGKALHFYRLPQNPKGLGIVVTSTSSRTIRLRWLDYCEFQSDDEATGEAQAVVTGVHSVVAYPPVNPSDATVCYVWVNTNALAGAKVSAAIFASS